MKISIVTVTYNCKNVVEETINSVLSQDYPDIDFVVIDGGSNDGTVQLIQKYHSRINVFISEKDKGIFDAMNKSLDYIKGVYVLFMNAGDRFVDTDVVSRIFLHQDRTEDLIYGDHYIQTKYGYKYCKADAIYERVYSVKDLVFKGQGICHQSLFTKTDRIRDIRFNLNYPLGADYDTTAKVYISGNHSIYYCGFPISVFDDRIGGVSHNKQIAILKERMKMFSYKPTSYDSILIYRMKLVILIKDMLTRIFPNWVDLYKKKKYKNTI